MARSCRSQEEEFDDDEYDAEVHPALKNHNRFGTQAMHVIGKTLKYAGIGALMGAVAFAVGAAALAALGVAATGPIGWIVSAVGLLGFSSVQAITTTMLVGAATTGALWGGGIGAAAGGLFGISEASEVADAEEDKLIAKYEQAQARAERMEALQARRDQQRFAMQRQGQMYGLGPQMPYGQGMGGRGGYGMSPT